MLFVRLDEPRRRLRLRARPLVLPYLFLAAACVPLLLLAQMWRTGATPPEIWPMWLVLPGMIVPFVLWLYNDSWTALELPAADSDEPARVRPGLLGGTLRPTPKQLTGVYVYFWGYRSTEGSGRFLNIAVDVVGQPLAVVAISVAVDGPDDPRFAELTGLIESLGYTVQRRNPYTPPPASAAPPGQAGSSESPRS